MGTRSKIVPTLSVALGVLVSINAACVATLFDWYPTVASAYSKTRDCTETVVTVVKTHRVFEPTPELPPPSYHPPLEIVVKGEKFRVVYYSRAYLRSHGVYAFSNFDEKKIALDVDETLDESRDSLLHEIEHMALAAAGGLGSFPQEEDEAEENVINPMTPVLLQVLRSNPKLVAWLTEGANLHL